MTQLVAAVRGLPVVLLLLSGIQAWAIPDAFAITVTNPNTKALATFNLERYNLRATNLQVRIYSDRDNYTLMDPLPEVPTFRGRITQDPTAFVSAVVKPNGQLYARVVYGNWWGVDPATGISSWELTTATAYRPTNTYTFTWMTNMPQTVSAGAYPAFTNGFGGPKYLNNMHKFIPRRAKICIDVVKDFYDSDCGDPATALAQAESKLADADFVTARDHLIAYQLVCVAIRTNVMDPYLTSGTSRLGDEANFWSPLRSSVGFDKVYAFTHIGGGVAYAPGDYSLEEGSWYGGVICHEGGHNWWAQDYETPYNYTGTNGYWHAMDGSGLCYSPDTVNRAQENLRGKSIEWIKYNYPLAPYATPDYAVTMKNMAVAIDVLLNDHDVNSNALSVVSFDATTLRGGSVALTSGSLRYTPPNNFVGYDTFFYKVGDGTGFQTPSQVMVLVNDAANALLAQYSFEQTNGSFITETSGRGVNGVLKGSLQTGRDTVPGISGNALHFNGAGKADLGNNYDPLSASYSLSLWFKPESVNGTRYLFAKGFHSSTWGGVRLYFNATGVTIEGDMFGNLPSGRFGKKRTTVIAVDTWYHVAAVLNRADNSVRIYVNGVEGTDTVYASTIPTGECIVGDGTARIGASTSDSDSYYSEAFIGTMDEVNIYSKALSAGEVASLFSAGGNIPSGAPNPADGERDVPLQPTLAWQAGRTNYQHDVYLGTTYAAVLNATTNSAEYKGRRTPANYTTANILAANTSFYWRVDEVIGGTNFVKGDVWTFLTAADAIHGGLKWHLTFDSRDTIGTLTYDRGGPPFEDGTLTGTPPLVAGEVSEALDFNGTSQYVEAPALNLNTDTATLLAWVKRNGSVNSWAGIIFSRAGNTVAGLHVGTANELRYTWADNASTYNWNSTLTLPDGQWALAALVVTSNRAVMYLGTTNGMLTAKTNSVTHAPEEFDGVIRVASDSTSSSRDFKGSIDEVCVWRRALTIAEIGQILTNGLSHAGIDGSPPAPQPGTFTWTGLADNQWTNSGNWAGGAVPTSGNTVIFDASSSRNLDTQIAQDFSVTGININSALRAAGVSGSNSLTLGAGGVIISNSFAAVSIGVPVILGANQSWVVSDLASLDVNANITNAGRTLTITNNSTVTLDGFVSGTGGLTFSGTGTNILNKLNTYSGQTTVNGGQVVLNTWQWYGGSVIGSGSLVINSNGWVRTTQPHVFNGGGQNKIYIYGGRLSFGAESYVNATFEMTGGLFDGQGEWRVQGNPVFRAATTPATVEAPMNLLDASRTFTVENGAASPDAFFLGTFYRGANITKAGAGTLSIRKPVSYTGNLTISAGTLELYGGDDLLPTGTNVSVSSGATLALADVSQTLGGLSGAGNVTLGAGSLTVDTTNQWTFTGIISGAPGSLLPAGDGDTQAVNSGGLTKDGSGKLTLGSRQLYTGDTWVLGGTLALTGSGSITNSANIVVSSGATLDVTARTDGTLSLVQGQALKGNGIVAGKVAVGSGSTISPGTSPGTLTTGAETWFGGGVCLWEINNATNATGWDRVTVNGALTLQSTPASKFTIKMISLTPTNTTGLLTAFNNRSNYQWTVLTASSVSGFDTNALAIDASAFANDLGGGTFDLSLAGNALVLNFRAFVPPPPVITSAETLTNGGFTLGGTGAPGWPYVLLAASNLIPPVTWTPLATNAADTNGFFNFTDLQTTNLPQRFYRTQAQ